MPAIASNVIVDSEAFRANRAAHLALIAERSRARGESARGLRPRRRQISRQRGQLPPRERINLLLDRDCAFLELSSALRPRHARGRRQGQRLWRRLDHRHRHDLRRTLHGRRQRFRHQGRRRASDGRREGDPRAGNRAARNKLPYVQLVESAGANLMLQAEMFVRGGATFANMARLSAAGIPVISIVHGSSTAGGAYQTGLADYVVMVRGRSKVFLAGPPLLKAATGEIAGDEALGGAELHCVDDGPRRISRRGRFRRAAHRARDSRQARLGAGGGARLPPRRRSTIPRSCSASFRSITANPTTCAR